jgi:hypothetical protein
VGPRAVGDPGKALREALPSRRAHSPIARKQVVQLERVPPEVVELVLGRREPPGPIRLELHVAGGGIARVSPGSRDVTPVTTGFSQATAVTTGFGYAWIASADGSVERIDPALLRPAGGPIQVGGSPTSITAGDGFVWAGGRRNPELTRIDPRARG